MGGYPIERINMLMDRKGWLKFRIGRDKDRRIKLSAEERKDIYKEYQKGGIGMRVLAKRYGVERTTIRNIVKPEKYAEQLKRYKEEKHYQKYYRKEKQREYMRNFRKHIREIKRGGEN